MREEKSFPFLGCSLDRVAMTLLLQAEKSQVASHLRFKQLLVYVLITCDLDWNAVEFKSGTLTTGSTKHSVFSNWESAEAWVIDDRSSSRQEL